MLKIDVIKFESQDVVTTSIPEPIPVTCECVRGCYYTASNHVIHGGCNSCKADTHPNASYYETYGKH